MTEAEKIILAENNKHISTEEILRDIEITKKEIATMKEEADHLEQTPLTMQNARMDHMRASSRRSGIVAREEFIKRLEAILEVRKRT
jgi:hypothetical protein